MNSLNLKCSTILNCKANVWKNAYLSPILNRGFLGAFVAALPLRASPNFSVTIHSFTLLPSSRPMIVAFVRCSDMTFSKRIQKTNKWRDLQNRVPQVDLESI